MQKGLLQTPDHRLIHVIQRAATEPPVGISTEARSRGRGAVTSFIPTCLAQSNFCFVKVGCEHTTQNASCVLRDSHGWLCCHPRNDVCEVLGQLSQLPHKSRFSGADGYLSFPELDSRDAQALVLGRRRRSGARRRRGGGAHTLSPSSLLRLE